MVIYPVPPTVTQARVQLSIDETAKAAPTTIVRPAGASGSQFFVVTAPDAGLPPAYAVLGKVVRGLPVVQRIGRLGDPASGGAGTPTETVEIEKATLHVG